MSALDMARDPRWGRSEECYSEDPCLAAAMAKAAVTGMQSTGVGMDGMACRFKLCGMLECI